MSQTGGNSTDSRYQFIGMWLRPLKSEPYLLLDLYDGKEGGSDHDNQQAIPDWHGLCSEDHPKRRHFVTANCARVTATIMTKQPSY